MSDSDKLVVTTVLWLQSEMVITLPISVKAHPSCPKDKLSPVLTAMSRLVWPTVSNCLTFLLQGRPYMRQDFYLPVMTSPPLLKNPPDPSERTFSNNIGIP